MIVVQIGSAQRVNHTSSLILFTLAQAQPGDMVIWLMTSLYSVRISPSSPYSMQSISTSILTTVFSLYSYSLHLDSQHPPSFTRMCTKKETINNKLCGCSLHDFPVSSPLSYSHVNSYTLTHPVQGIFLAAWPVRFPDQSISQSQKTPLHRSSTTFSTNLQLNPRLPQLSRAVHVSARCSSG